MSSIREPRQPVDGVLEWEQGSGRRARPLVGVPEDLRPGPEVPLT